LIELGLFAAFGVAAQPLRLVRIVRGSDDLLLLAKGVGERALRILEGPEVLRLDDLARHLGAA
jgi:hypothetical protein